MEKEIFKVVSREVSSNIGDNIKLILQYAKDEKALFTLDEKDFSIVTKVFVDQIEIIFKPTIGEEFSICFANSEKEGFLYIQDKEKISFKKMRFKTNHSNINKNKYWYVNIFHDKDEGEQSINNKLQTFLLPDYDKNMDKLNNKAKEIFKILNLIVNKNINEKIDGFIKNINLENQKEYLQLIENNKDNLKDFLIIHDKVLDLGFCPYNLKKEDKEIIFLQTDDNLDKLKIEKNIFKNVIAKFFKK